MEKKRRVYLHVIGSDPNPNLSQIAQISYIIHEQSGVADLKKGVNYFFSGVKMAPQIVQQTGLTQDLLTEKAGNLAFSDVFSQITSDLKDAELICFGSHEVISLLKQEYIRCVSVFRPASRYCVMSAFKPVLRLTSGPILRNPTLPEVLDNRFLSRAESRLEARKTFSSDPYSEQDPRFVVSALFLLASSGPLPQLHKEDDPLSLQHADGKFRLTQELKESLHFPDELWTVTQFLQFVYAALDVPSSQRLLQSQVFDELKKEGIFATAEGSKKTVLPPKAAQYGFVMQHRQQSQNKSYDVIAMNDRGKMFLLNKLQEMHYQL